MARRAASPINIESMVTRTKDKLEIGMHTALTGAYSRLSSLISAVRSISTLFFEVLPARWVPMRNNRVAK
jgi:hypothetical protein